MKKTTFYAIGKDQKTEQLYAVELRGKRFPLSPLFMVVKTGVFYQLYDIEGGFFLIQDRTLKALEEQYIKRNIFEAYNDRRNTKLFKDTRKALQDAIKSGNIRSNNHYFIYAKVKDSKANFKPLDLSNNHLVNNLLYATFFDSEEEAIKVLNNLTRLNKDLAFKIVVKH